MMNLLQRVEESKMCNMPVHSRYVVAFDDDVDAPVKILHLDPNWMASALAGGVLPELSVYHNAVYRLTVSFPNEQPVTVNIKGINLKDAKADALARGASIDSEIIVHHDFHDGPTAGPMSEVQAVDYIIQKALPASVWNAVHNRDMFKVLHVDQLPQRRESRNTWSMCDV